MREAAALILPLADAAGRAIELDIPDRLQVRGRGADLRDVFRNLLENALVHGSGTIHVRGMRSPGECRAVVTVADEGTGLPTSQRERMFERFQKATRNTAGSGLGLAIVRELVHAHGGVVCSGRDPRQRFGFNCLGSMSNRRNCGGIPAGMSAPLLLPHQATLGCLRSGEEPVKRRPAVNDRFE